MDFALFNMILNTFKFLVFPFYSTSKATPKVWHEIAIKHPFKSYFSHFFSYVSILINAPLLFIFQKVGNFVIFPLKTSIQIFRKL